MKKLYTFLLAAALLSLGSCEKDLDQNPLSNGSVPDFYQTATDFDQALTAVYSQLRGYPDRLLVLSEIRSDNIYGVSSQGVRDWDPINNFNSTLAINPYVSDTWAQDYNAIYRANLFLDQLNERGGAVLNETLRKRYEAEARFLRAFHYFDLVRTFGAVPLIERAVGPEEVAKIGRAPVAQVYELIIADLTFATTNLATTYTGANVGRASTGAAKGLLALVYLTRSGPTYNIAGPGLATNDYAAAITLLDDIINARGTARYALITATGSAPSAYGNVFSYANENNAEVLFDVQYIVGNGATHPGLLVPPGYFTSLGIPFDSRGIEIKPVSTDLLTSYAANDPRKAFAIQTGYTTTNPAFTENRSLFKKYISAAGRGTGGTDWPINFITMRYADVLLLKAEALLRSGGSAGDAAALVNQVRARAGLSALTSITLPQLMEERRREFAAEGLRWHDLVRTGLVLTVMNDWIARENPGGKIQQVVPNYIIYPVPQSELSATPGLYAQNPGY
ncbi:RagB/SusD family nutrient uptake outer membrane protein [Hymenobacter sp. CRA2]|uniref:RagB/SusD family nutrient uptake outer membrane protein n=1 Tax=Hymenobacter sp. CRA2 TaxID=1955620 RepID=UPI00098FF3CB|nr:RagB/SusD family nutrient uptake outer membrane protein [Hymenobacter sp. CRA2]OON66495.1 hypothetical protein B0919_21950 [Hymenobacter sp. CRA2]